MTPAADRIVQGLQRAIEAEAAGYHFYMMAARSTQDQRGKTIFETLAEEELSHLAFLQAQHRSFLERGAADTAALLGKPLDLSGASPIFSPRLRERIQEAHYEMSALSIGIELELSSLTFYKGEAEASPDRAAKEFYTRLADWETGHYQALLRQREAFREDYWSRGGFAPF